MRDPLAFCRAQLKGFPEADDVNEIEDFEQFAKNAAERVNHKLNGALAATTPVPDHQAAWRNQGWTSTQDGGVSLSIEEAEMSQPESKRKRVPSIDSGVSGPYVPSASSPEHSPEKQMIYKKRMESREKQEQHEEEDEHQGGGRGRSGVDGNVSNDQDVQGNGIRSLRSGVHGGTGYLDHSLKPTTDGDGTPAAG